MALRRRTGARFENNVWAGFVDAMTALLLVMIFVLSIFMIIQVFLRNTIDGQRGELNTLSNRINIITQALGGVTNERDALLADNQSLDERLARLQFQYDTQSNQIANFETQVAGLIAQNRELLNNINQLEADLTTAEANAESVENLETQLAALLADQGALQAETADAMALLAIALSKTEDTEIRVELEEKIQALSEAERAQLVEAATAQVLQERLKNSEAELTALTLALENERQQAEDTLTLLAALNNDRDEIIENSTFSEAQKTAALLSIAEQELALREKVSMEDARQIALLNQQTAELRAQLGGLQKLLNDSIERDRGAGVQLESLGSNVNAALARLAAEEKQRANSLEAYRSEFFGRLREVLSNVEGVDIVGDRFVFSSGVLFASGSADISADGSENIADIARIVQEISKDIPAEINWVIRVDGHTDITPVSSDSWEDNWELSQARALSVVRALSEQHGILPNRLAAAGFGEYHPIDSTDSPEAYARNRRIELKLTEQ